MNLIWCPPMIQVKRQGVLGKLLDRIFPKYVVNKSPYAGRFVAFDSCGKMASTSPDGITWERQNELE